MSRFMKLFSVLRRNWKKTTFGLVAISYAGMYVNETLQNNILMKKYCQIASFYGRQTLTIEDNPYRVVVILNPAANGRKAKKEYERYCAPILNLAGMYVNVLTTTGEKSVTNLLHSISDKADAIIIAGGDGTVSEVVTELMRRFDGNTALLKKVPFGILPLGRINNIAHKLYPQYTISADDVHNSSPRIHLLAEASLAVIVNKLRLLDVVQIENIEDEHENFKPVYAVNEIHWGPFQDAAKNSNRFWYFGKFRTYISYVFGSYNRNRPIRTHIDYTKPCSGCVNCYKQRMDIQHDEKPSEISEKRWWHAFIPRFQRYNENNDGDIIKIDYSQIQNPECGKNFQKDVDTVDLKIAVNSADGISRLSTSIGPPELSYLEFVKEGWSRESNKESTIDSEMLYAQQVVINNYDQTYDDKESWFSIDNEQFELKRKMRLTLLNQAVSMVCTAP